MRVSTFAVSIVAATLVLTMSCQKPESGNDKSDGQAEDPGKVKLDVGPTGLEGLGAVNLTVPDTLPPVAANTPGSLAITLGAALTMPIDCRPDHAENCPANADQKACIFIEDVKCRFFGESGPTQIKQILGNLDQNMAEFESRSKDTYVPCLDPVGNKDGLTVRLQGEGERIFKPFVAVPFDTKFTGLKDKFGAAIELDLGFEYSLNCITNTNDDKSSWSAIGVKTEAGKTTYTLSSLGGKDGDRNGNVGTIDAVKNVEYWGIVSQGGKTATVDLTMSNALIHLVSNAADKTIQLSFTGVNVGPGCGMRMITTDTFLFAEANTNMVGKCEQGDAGYEVGDDNLTFCVKVDGADPEVAQTSECTAVGLTAASFSIDALSSEDVQPFEIYKLFPSLDGVPAFVDVPFPPKDGEQGTPAGDSPGLEAPN